jgi:hypothetical protein
MTPQKIITIIEGYEQQLAALGVERQRMDPFRTFASTSMEERLMHAHYLCGAGVKEYAFDPLRQRKTGSHLTAIQMCLSFADWYTLQQLMEANKP